MKKPPEGGRGDGIDAGFLDGFVAHRDGLSDPWIGGGWQHSQ
jgi:hypothetical protein